MTISPDIENGPFVGNGTQVAFAFTFTAITPAEVAVSLDGVAQTTGYTVSLAENGGTVTFAAPPAAGAQIVLRSNPDYLQDSAFENEGAYNLATVNTINRRQAVRALVTRKRLDATSVAAAEASAAAAATAAAAAAGAVSAAAGSASAAAGAASAAGSSAAGAANSASAAAGSVGGAALAAATAGAYPNTAATNVPRGLTQASVGAITGGSGGANGTYSLSWSGGNFAINPTGTFTVSGGALTAVTITGPGLHIGATVTVPTPSFAASAGLTGAAVALTAQFLVANGMGYWVQSADNTQLLRYANVSGAATADPTIGPLPTSVAYSSIAAIETDFFAGQFKSAVGTGNLRLLVDADGPRIAYNGSPTILTELESLDDTPVALTLSAFISTQATPRPVHTPGRGIFLSSQAGLQNTTTPILTSTNNDFALFAAWDLNVPMLSTTVNHASDLSSLTGVEGDVAKVIGDTTTNLSPDIPVVIDSELADAQLVNGYYYNWFGTWLGFSQVLFNFINAGGTKRFTGYINKLGQLSIYLYDNNGSKEWYLISKGSVVLTGKLTIAIRNYRNTATLYVNGSPVHGVDLSKLSDMTDLTRLYINGRGRNATTVNPIDNGLRHYLRGFALVQSMPESAFVRAYEVFLRRYATPEATPRPARMGGVIVGGQSHADGYFLVSNTWTMTSGFNGNIVTPNVIFDTRRQTATRENSPNFYAHNLSNVSSIGPLAVRAQNYSSVDTAISYSPSSYSEGFALGMQKQINAVREGAARDWMLTPFAHGGATLAFLYAEPNVYLPHEYKGATVSAVEYMAQAKQAMVYEKDFADARGQIYTVDWLLWLHGHADSKVSFFSDNPSYASLFLTNIYDNLNAFAKALTGQSHDVMCLLVSPSYSQTGLSTNTINQDQRMLDIVASRGTRPIYMGPNEGAWSSFEHNYPLGQRALGEAIGLAMMRIQFGGERFVAISPNAYTYALGGTTIDIDYNVRAGEALRFRDTNAHNIDARQRESGVDTYGFGYFQKSADVTVGIASPGVVTWNAHGLSNGALVRLYTLGVLPTGLSPGTDYYVVNATTNTFQLSLTNGGAAINTVGTQSGVHTAYDVSTKISSVVIPSSTVTVTVAAPSVIAWTGHPLVNGVKVRLSTTGVLPTGFSANTDYYVVAKTANTFQLAPTPGGTAINTSGSQSGTHTATAASRVRVTVGAPIVPNSELHYSGFNARVGNLASDTAPTAYYKDQDWTIPVVSGTVNFGEGTLNDLTSIANGSRKVLT